MKRIKGQHCVLLYILCLVLAACSTTKNLPDEEVLYTGIKKITVTDEDKTAMGENTLAEVKAALACSPNNSVFGIRYPFPLGLWIYNDFVNAKRKVGKWVFNKFAAKPIFISTVNPAVRTKIAENLLHDYGFFNGRVSYTVVPSSKPRQAKINYQIDMNHPYLLDSVMYLHYPSRMDSLVKASYPQRLLRKNDNFSVVQLDAERGRLSTLFRNNGYFYFRPDFITFRADTLQYPGKVSLQVIPKSGLPASIVNPWKIGRTSVYLTGYNGTHPTDSINYKDMTIHYSGKRPGVRPSVLYKQLDFKKGNFYSQQEQMKSQESIYRLGIFKLAELQYLPQDTTSVCDTLNVNINAVFDLPLDGELELNVTSKSNNQIGPGAIFSVSKRNIFRGGETFGVKLRGSYEWQTNAPVDAKSSVINSYELGLSSTLDFPRVVFPRMSNHIFAYPATTTFRLYADQLNRARFFKMLSFGGTASYNFQPSTVSQHSITPFGLAFNLLQSTTHRFDSITTANPALYMSLKNQFVPSMSYTYTYDDANVTSIRNHTWWQTSIISAGNITSCVYAIFGDKFTKKGKQLFSNPFAQFTKLTSEVRYDYKIDRNQHLAMRLMGGVAYAYGNAEVVPYNEQFYIGGANSIRAFTARSLGPGSFRPKEENSYSYIDQTGDIKLEANIEYRFRLIGDLYGATFLDAGNIWLLKKDPSRPGGQFSLSNFGKALALGTGVGIRYDLSFLVLRLDMGIALHAPYETSRSGYYNIPKFKDGMGIHLAIGYPF
ncbi:MAG: BamA/TamA family outer membrane protein [Bacteroides sp.]